MFIKNYKYLEDGRTEIEYTVPAKRSSDKPEKMVCQSNDQPKESFTEALISAKDVFKRLAEQGADVKDINIRAIKFKKKGKDDSVLVCIISSVGLSKSTGSIPIPTPYYYTTNPIGDTAGLNILSVPDIAIIDSIISECKDYVNGDRLQVEADLETESEENPEESEY